MPTEWKPDPGHRNKPSLHDSICKQQTVINNNNNNNVNMLVDKGTALLQ